jgi:ATP-binding cassette subfamily B protein
MTLTKKSNGSWKNLLVLHQPFWPGLAASAALTIGAVGLELILPLVYRFTIDTMIMDKPAILPAWLTRIFLKLGGRDYLLGHFWLIGLVIVGIISLEGLFNFLRGAWIARAAEGGARRLRTSLFSHIQSLPYGYHSRVETGDLIQRCTSDVDAIRRFFEMQLLEIIRCSALVASTIVIMASLNGRMTLIALAATPIIFAMSVRYFQVEKKAFQSWDEAEGSLSTQLQESMTGIRVVKAFARQAYERAQFAAKNETLRRHGWKTFDIIANFWMLSDWVCLLQVLTVTLVGTILVVQGTISLGLFIVFIAYTDMLLHPLRNLARMLADAGKMQISFGRLQTVLDEPAEPDDTGLADLPLSGRIEFRAVDFAFAASQRFEANQRSEAKPRPILNKLSFAIKPGQTVGILGPTGSGKSTIFYLLQRLYDPTGGEILLDGHEIRTLQRKSVRRQIGLILQESYVFSRTVLENIRLPRPDAPDEAVYDSARTAALHHDILHFEAGYQTIVGERGVTLSGGQKQRLAIARTLIRECPIILFDDSLSAVDTETDAQIRQALSERREKATTLIISHRISTLAEADWILVLEDGQITAQGTHGDLISQPGLYQRVCQIQNELLTQLDNEVQP